MAKHLRGSRPDNTRKKGARRGLLPMTSNVDEEIASRRPTRQVLELEPRTERQAEYINAIRTSTLTFGIGPAGTGKTFVAACLAAEALLSREVDRLVITRPAVEAGESLGFLPGDLSEKFGPYMTPLNQVLEKRLGAGAFEAMLKGGRIEALPLALMRGRSLENSFVILDEAQNTTPAQMKLFLTRMGEGSRIVVDGDPTQRDIPGASGLIDAVRRLRRLPTVSTVVFDRGDIVRSGLVQMVVEAYETRSEEAEMEDEGLRRMLAAE